VKRKTGRLGQFDVLVDGQVIASRSARGWPDAEAVIASIEALQAQKQRS